MAQQIQPNYDIGYWDGYISLPVCTYVSATSFTTATDLSAVLAVGDKIKLTQTTAKYFYVVSVSGTTVTVTGGTDYTLANAAITSPLYSKEASPASFPQWFSYTPTFTGGTGGVVSPFRFNIVERICTITTVGTGAYTSNAATFTASLPVTSATVASGEAGLAMGASYDSGFSANVVGIARVQGSSSVVIFHKNTFAVDNWSASGTKAWYGVFSYQI